MNWEEELVSECVSLLHNVVLQAHILDNGGFLTLLMAIPLKACIYI